VSVSNTDTTPTQLVTFN